MTYSLNDIVVTKDGRIGEIIFFRYFDEEEFVSLRLFSDLDIKDYPTTSVMPCVDEGAIAIAKVSGYELLTNEHTLDDLVTLLECRDLNFMLENYHAAVGDMVNVYIATKDLLSLCKTTKNVPSEIILAAELLKDTCGICGDEDD